MAVVDTFMGFALAMLALWLKMDAEKISVLRLDWNAKQ